MDTTKNMKSAKEIKLFGILSEKYSVKYEPKKFHGELYSLKVDFELTDEYGNVIYLEYSGMNFFKKYLKIIDVAQNNPNIFVIFDDEDMMSEIQRLNESDLSYLTLQKTMTRINNFYKTCTELCKTQII